MFVLYEAMILMINVFKYCPRGYIKGGYYLFTRPSTAGIIRVRVLFEGGSYLRKYGTYAPPCSMSISMKKCKVILYRYEYLLNKFIVFSHQGLITKFHKLSNQCEKNCSSDREKLLKFEAEGREFAIIKVQNGTGERPLMTSLLGQVGGSKIAPKKGRCRVGQGRQVGQK